MMTFASPFVLGIAAAAALVIAGLHLLSVRRPPELLLPTARFLPATEVRAVSRTRTPSDLLLLLLRVGALLAAGFALAGPRFTTTRAERVALVGVEPGVLADTAAVRRLLATDVLTANARVVLVAESLSAPTGTMLASYDAAQLFPRAIQLAARTVRDDLAVDSLALIVLRAHSTGSDSAWSAWRSAWPGSVVTYSPPADASQPPPRRVARRVVLVPVAAVDGTPTNGSPRDGMPPDDVVEASFRWHAARVNHNDRSASDTAVVVDSIFLSRIPSRQFAPRDGSLPGRVSIYWPLDGAPNMGAAINGTPANGATTGQWRGWQAAPAGDTASALVAGGIAMMGGWPVAQFGRWNAFVDVDTSPNTEADTLAPRWQPFAWWSDGRVAAIEQYAGKGCERTVAVMVAQGHDILLSPAANGLFDRLLAPCKHPASVAIAALSLRTASGTTLAPASAFRGGDPDDIMGGATPNRVVRWIPSLLLALSLVALVAEWRVRRIANAPSI